MMNDMESAPEGGMNEMEESGETGTCIKLYIGPDGSYSVSKSQESAPKDGQPAESLDEALMMAKDMAMEPEGDQDAMMAAERGYKSKAQPLMQAPNPDRLFGE